MDALDVSAGDRNEKIFSIPWRPKDPKKSPHPLTINLKIISKKSKPRNN